MSKKNNSSENVQQAMERAREVFVSEALEKIMFLNDNRTKSPKEFLERGIKYVLFVLYAQGVRDGHEQTATSVKEALHKAYPHSKCDADIIRLGKQRDELLEVVEILAQDYNLLHGPCDPLSTAGRVRTAIANAKRDS